MIKKEQILNLIADKIAEDELFVVDLKISAANKITLKIDSLKGLSITQCVSVSRVIENNLDREVEDYELEVTSPGLTEAFKVVEQYHKNIGRDLKVITTTGKEFKGSLIRADDKQIELAVNEKIKVEGVKQKQLQVNNYIIEYTNIKSATIVIKF